VFESSGSLSWRSGRSVTQDPHYPYSELMQKVVTIFQYMLEGDSSSNVALKRENKNSILKKFNIDQIREYFPTYASPMAILFINNGGKQDPPGPGEADRFSLLCFDALTVRPLNPLKGETSKTTYLIPLVSANSSSAGEPG
jgi:hypothetical protein